MPIVEFQPVTDFEKFTTLLYAPPGWGKTTFGMSMADPVIAPFEDGVKAKSGRAIGPVGADGRVHINTWKEFGAELAWLVKHLEQKPGDVKTLLVDTVDIAFDRCRHYLFEKHNIDHEADLKYGKGHDLVKSEFKRLIEKMTNIGVGVVFISHQKLNDRDDSKVARLEPSLRAAAAEMLIGLCDLVLCGMFRTDPKTGEEVRIVATGPSSKWIAKNRVEHVELPPLISVPKVDPCSRLQAALRGGT